MIKKLVSLFTLIGFILAANSQNPARRTPVAGGQSIAKWKIEDVVRSYSANNDTVYVVNFWATFCKPCIEEIPDFIKIVEKYKAQKVKLLLVSLDLPAFYPAKIASFAKKNNYNTKIVWLNETNADHFCPAIDKQWSGAIPSTIIVNNKTGYKKFVEDQMTPETFEASLKEAIGGNVYNKYLSPMNDAEVIDKESLQKSAAANSMDFVSFKSDDSTVYAVTGGQVNMVARIENIKVVIIEKDERFYTYSNLSSTSLKKGDQVKQDQLIGYAAHSLDGDKPTIEFYVNDRLQSILLTKENFIQRKDKRLLDHSIETDLQEPQ